ncbi:MAG: flippase-like domain-containing protein [Actinobacteria bacterium]|nr:flippase-like domain-containing protein [Actinomycetota bacterium]
MAGRAKGRTSRFHLRGLHWYSSQAGTELRRRPTDVVLLVACLLALLLLAPAAPGPSPVDESLTSAVQGLPAWVTWIFPVGYAVAGIWALLLVVVPLVTPHRQRLAAYLLLAAVIAFGFAALVGVIEGTAWGTTWSALWSTDPPPVFTAVRVAVITAVIVASSPHLSHPLRMFGRLLVVVVPICAVAISVAYPVGALAALLIGVAGAAVMHLLVGSPAGRPSVTRVADALDDLGLAEAQVTDLAIPTAGQSLFAASVPGQPDLLVTVLGRDEWDAQAMASLWTAATRRGERVRLTTTRLARVEHDAMMSLLAERAGVRVLPIVAVGRSAEGDAVLVTHAPGGPSMTDMSPQDVTDDLLDQAWAQVAALHEAGIAHGRLDGSRIVLDAEGRLALTDFSDAERAADRRLLMFDRARLLTATALATDGNRAVASAHRMLGSEGLVELLPFLQPAVLDHDTRARISAGEWDLKALRDTATAAANVDAPKLEQLRRVSGRSLVMTTLIVVLTYGLISVFSGVDFAEVWADLQSADWMWLFVALLVSPLAQASFAFSTIGATTASLRYYPVLMLQFALQFIAVALPATAARIAMDVRFFQSFGVASGAAVSIGMIDSFSGFVVQIILLAVILLSGLPAFTQPVGSSGSSTSDSSDSSSPSMVALMLAIAIVSLIVVLVVPRLRRQFSGRMRSAWASFLEQAQNAKGALDVLRRPSKVLEMLAGNLGAQVVQAIVLGLCLTAFGQEAALSQLILINTAVSLFAGLMPVPGGVGVAEAGLTAGLTAIGIPSSIAISTAIAFRLVTFYLPPLWGSLAMRWLRKHSYV